MASPLLELWCSASANDPDDRGPTYGLVDRSDGDASDSASSPNTSDPDAELVPRIRNGDAGALESLMRRHAESLWRFAQSYVVSSPAAREVVHDTFVALWELGARWHVSGTVRAYLFGAVRNRVLNLHKHDLRMQRFAQRTAEWDDAPAMGGHPDAADAALLLEEQQALLRRAVATLPVRWRQAVILRVQEQLSYEDIGTVLGISSGAARKLVERAQRDLRTFLAPYLGA